MLGDGRRVARGAAQASSIVIRPGPSEHRSGSGAWTFIIVLPVHKGAGRQSRPAGREERQPVEYSFDLNERPFTASGASASLRTFAQVCL